MARTAYPVGIVAAEAPLRAKPSSSPELFAPRMVGRRKQQLGDLFGLSNFGVNLTRLLPGAQSALRHAHSRQDEFVYILQGSYRVTRRCTPMRVAPSCPLECAPALARALATANT